MINVTADFVTKKEKDYPYMGGSHNGTIVLFTEPESGVVLKQGGSRPQGHYRTDWIEDIFTPIEGTITISNK